MENGFHKEVKAFDTLYPPFSPNADLALSIFKLKIVQTQTCRVGHHLYCNRWVSEPLGKLAHGDTTLS